MKSLNILFFLLAVLLAESAVLAQDYDPRYDKKLQDNLTNYVPAGQAAMPFLKQGGSARNMAMGDAAITMKGDASALFYNPAGIAYVQGGTATFSYISWLLDTSFDVLAFAYNYKNLGTIGFSLMYYDYGGALYGTQINKNDPRGYSETGEFTPKEFVGGIAYARQISSQFSIGAQIKLAYQDLLGGGRYNTYNASTGERGAKKAESMVVAADVGTIYDVGWRDLTLSVSFRNFGENIEYERETFELPVTFRMGLSFELFKALEMNVRNHKVLLAMERLHPRDWSETMQYGVEYGFKDMVFLRGGYKANYTSEGLTLGFGLLLDTSVGKIGIDYAYKESGVTFKSIHVYTMTVAF